MAQKACNALELKLRWKRILRKGVSPSPPDQEEPLWHCVMQVSGKALNPLNGRFLDTLYVDVEYYMVPFLRWD